MYISSVSEEWFYFIIVSNKYDQQNWHTLQFNKIVFFRFLLKEMTEWIQFQLYAFAPFNKTTSTQILHDSPNTYIFQLWNMFTCYCRLLIPSDPNILLIILFNFQFDRKVVIMFTIANNCKFLAHINGGVACLLCISSYFYFFLHFI